MSDRAMSDGAFDARFESLLREALKAEASSLPLRVGPDQIVERANVRDGAHVGPRLGRPVFGQPSSVLRRFSMAVAAGAAAVVIVIAGAVGLNLFVNQQGIGAGSPNPTPAPSTAPSLDLGIFEPAAGRIVYYDDSSLWALDPRAPAPVSTLVRLGADETADQFASFTVPLGWSSDGTKLLFKRRDSADQTFPYDHNLYILHTDGSETQVTPDPVADAAISPDGSRVAFSPDGEGLYVVGAEGGEPIRIAAEGASPTFSPDGTRIAYLSLPRSGCCVHPGREHVWVVKADGTDAHEILAAEPALAQGVFQLTWSPVGDRIAMANGLGGHVAIYTFEPDGSNFTKVVTGGFNPHWSPDGSQIAYEVPGRGVSGVYLADADGSNVRALGFGRSGPWHPVRVENGGGG